MPGAGPSRMAGDRPQSFAGTLLNQTTLSREALLISLDLCSCQEHTPPESPLCRALSNRRKGTPEANESFAANSKRV
jgi:hypothetical protein